MTFAIFSASGTADMTTATATPTTYAYKVRDRRGRLVEGTIEAPDEQLVLAKLKEMGVTPVSISARSKSALKSEIKIGRGRVKGKDLAVFSRQLATMINAGLSLLRALTVLRDQTQSAALAAVIGQIKDDIEQGLSFSQAVARHPKVFPPIYVALVRAGETGGMLDATMVRLADTL